MLDIDIASTVGYYRVSTPRQSELGHAMERYKEQLIDFGIPEHQIFCDVESGSSATRDGYSQVLEACRTWARCIVVPRFDRFTRSSLLWAQAREEFASLGVRFIDLSSGRRPKDISSPTGILTTGLEALFAEHERMKNRQASLDGYARRRAMGKAHRASFGYLMDKDGKLWINNDPYPNSDRTIKEVALELIETFLRVGTSSGTLREVCPRYGFKRHGSIGQAWVDFPRDHTGLRDWLSNPVLIGSTVYFPASPKRYEVPNTHEPLIDVATFQQVQQTLAVTRNASRGKSESRNPLRNTLYGLIYCAGCGSTMRAQNCDTVCNGRRYIYYYLWCNGAAPRAGKPKVCDRKTSYGWTVAKLETEVIKQLTERAEAIAGKALEGGDQAVHRTPEMVEIEAQIRQFQALNDPDLAETIRLKQVRLQSLIAKAERASDAVRHSREAFEMVYNNPNFWDKSTPEARRGMFLELVKRIEIDRESIKITFAV